jgi:hypothetical protein
MLATKGQNQLITGKSTRWRFQINQQKYAAMTKELGVIVDHKNYKTKKRQ